MNCYLALSLFLYLTSIVSYVIYPHISNTALKLKTAVLWSVIIRCLVMSSSPKMYSFLAELIRSGYFYDRPFGPGLCLKSFDVTSKPSNWTNKCSCCSERNCLRSALMKLWLVLIRVPLRGSCTSEGGIHHRLRN
jgi:hypothetical protein